jgi:type I restriction enzyme R subunit
MVVCMSRRICVELYNEIVRLRPEWHHEDDDKGVIKVVMTGSASDPPEWQPHIRNKDRREFLAKRFRDPNDPFKIVIVRDMWLTGFDCPSLHTMYVDKPMRAHGLMQAIARVNRAFRDKPGGLVVDYLGLAHELKQALATYTESGGRGKTAIDQAEAVAAMKEKYEVCCDLFHGFDWSRWKTGKPEERLALLPAAQEHILAQENGKERLLKAVTELSKAFALAVPHEEALAIRDDVAFFQAVRAALAKRAPMEERPEEELDHAIRQIISRAITPEGVVDLFAAAGLKKPDSPSSPTSSWPRSGGCRRRTWPWSSSASSSRARSRSGGARTWCRRGRSRRGWNRRSGATRTGPWRRCRSSRSSLPWLRKCVRRTGGGNCSVFPKRNSPSTRPWKPTITP